MTAPQPTGEFIREDGTAPGVQVWNLQGMPWHDAPIPPRDHLCWTQTKGTLPDGNFVRRFVRRCACGAISMKDHDDRHIYWMDRNSRKALS